MLKDNDLKKKIISKEEVEIIGILEYFSLKDITLIYSLNDNTLYERVGFHQSRLEWDIIKIYSEVLYPLHVIKTNSFTPGVYTFINSGNRVRNDDYFDHILDELKVFVLQHKGNTLIGTMWKTINERINTLRKKGVIFNQYSLLHGDLHNGNILVFDNHYKLIDFEYVRFGPVCIEWAFLLFWDLIVETNIKKREKIVKLIGKEIRELLDKQVLNNIQVEMIIDIFIPIILCSSLHYAISSKYEKSIQIKNGIVRFWLYEYKLFVKESKNNE